MGLTLAAYLLLDAPSARSRREEAARFLWEGLDKERQSGNLRQLLLRLRALQAMHAVRLFVIDEDEIALDLERADVDLAAFRAATRRPTTRRPRSPASFMPATCSPGSMNRAAVSRDGWRASARLLRAEFVAAILPVSKSRETESASEDPSGELRDSMPRRGSSRSSRFMRAAIAR